MMISNMYELKTNDHIELTQTINHTAVIIYDQNLIPDVQELIDQCVLCEDILLLYRNKTYSKSHKSYREGNYYLLMQVTEENSKEQFDEIERVIGFGDLIIGVGLDRDKQIFLQRKFFQMCNYFLSLNLQNEDKPKNQNEHHEKLNFVTLHFLNCEYKKSYARINDQIYYWKKIKEIRDFLGSDKYKTLQRYNSLIHSYEEMSQKNNQQTKSTSFTIDSLINILNSSRFYEKPSFFIKQTFIAFHEIQRERQRLLQAQHIVFSSAFEEVNFRAVQTKLSEFNLKKPKKQKLQWKYKQMKRYRELLEQQQANKELVMKYKSSPIYQLTQNIINLQIREFHRSWIKQTLKKLKNSFNMIANRRDVKAIEHFRSLCEKTKNKIEKCLKSVNLEQSNKEILQRVKIQIEDFVEYHEAVIAGDRFFGGFEFYRKQLGYYWRNERKIYEKISLFLVVLIFATIQDNVILGFTLVAVGLIFSAVNF